MHLFLVDFRRFIHARLWLTKYPDIMIEHYNSDNERTFDIIAPIVAHIGALYYQRYYGQSRDARLESERFRGEAYLSRILASNRLARSIDAFRMPTATFRRLCSLLQGAGLSGSHLTSPEQKLAIFLYMVGHGSTQRVTGEVFGHASVQISR